ncbi:hypothetical protein B0H65DRAFT_414243, partial [Neurospora tetraspora]
SPRSEEMDTRRSGMLSPHANCISAGFEVLTALNQSGCFIRNNQLRRHLETELMGYRWVLRVLIAGRKRRCSAMGGSVSAKSVG